MENGCLIIIGSLLAIIVLYGLFELHYFLRMCLCGVLARFFKRKCHILDTTTVTGFCLTNDIDALITHMNNARYFRELDFARIDFYERTSLYRTIVAKGGSVYQGAATIRYRRFIRPFHRFKIQSKIIYWDDQSVYMEHQFIRPSDNFVHAIAICRQRIVDCSAEEVMDELLKPLQQRQIHGTPARSTDTLDRNEYGMATTNLDQAENGEIHATAYGTTATVNLDQVKNGEIRASDAAQYEAATSNLDQAENGQVPARTKRIPPPEIVKWIEYNELSSKNLRKGC